MGLVGWRGGGLRTLGMCVPTEGVGVSECLCSWFGKGQQRSFGSYGGPVKSNRT